MEGEAVLHGTAEKVTLSNEKNEYNSRSLSFCRLLFYKTDRSYYPAFKKYTVP